MRSHSILSRVNLPIDDLPDLSRIPRLKVPSFICPESRDVGILQRIAETNNRYLDHAAGIGLRPHLNLKQLEAFYRYIAARSIRSEINFTYRLSRVYTNPGILGLVDHRRTSERIRSGFPGQYATRSFLEECPALGTKEARHVKTLQSEKKRELIAFFKASTVVQRLCSYIIAHAISDKSKLPTEYTKVPQLESILKELAPLRQKLLEIVAMKLAAQDQVVEKMLSKDLFEPISRAILRFLSVTLRPVQAALRNPNKSSVKALRAIFQDDISSQNLLEAGFELCSNFTEMSFAWSVYQASVEYIKVVGIDHSARANSASLKKKIHGASGVTILDGKAERPFPFYPVAFAQIVEPLLPLRYRKSTTLSSKTLALGVLVRSALSTEGAMANFESKGANLFDKKLCVDSARPFLAYRAAQLVTAERSVLDHLSELGQVDQAILLRRRALSTHYPKICGFAVPVTQPESLPIMSSAAASYVLGIMESRRNELRTKFVGSRLVRDIIGQLRHDCDLLSNVDKSAAIESLSKRERLIARLANYREEFTEHSSADMKRTQSHARRLLFDQLFESVSSVIIEEYRSALTKVGLFFGAAIEKRTETLKERSKFIARYGPVDQLLADYCEMEYVRADYHASRSYVAYANSRLVRNIVTKYEDRGISRADLIQEGSEGLMKAIDRFDLKRNLQFATFASHWIPQPIMVALWDRSNAFSLPSHYSKLYRAMTELETSAMAHGARPYSEAELAQKLNTSEGEMKLIRAPKRQAVSLSQTIGSRDGLTVLDVDPALHSDPRLLDDQQNILDLRDLIGAALKEVSEPRDREIVRLRFGLDDGVPQPLEDLAKQFRLTKSRVQQIVATTLKLLAESRYGLSLKGLLGPEPAELTNDRLSA